MSVRLTNEELREAICATHTLMQEKLPDAVDDIQVRVWLKLHLERLIEEQRHRALGLAKPEIKP